MKKIKASRSEDSRKALNKIFAQINDNTASCVCALLFVLKQERGQR